MQLLTRDTVYSADSVEFCPLEDHHDVLAVGTYQVDKSEDEAFSASQRKGRIYLQNGLEDAFAFSLDFDPILDMKWSGHRLEDKAVLAAVDAKGYLTLFSLHSDGGLTLKEWTKELASSEEGVLALSLDWSTRKDSSSEPLIAVSDSKGNVNVKKLSESKLESVFSAKCHDFEAWITCFDAWCADVVFTGGDDARLKGFDVRVGGGRAAFVCKEHMAGVTSLLSDVYEEKVLYSGSYDESMCKWDTRNMRSPVAKVDLGGGVWRIRQHPARRDLLAAACMHGGFKLLEGCEVSEAYSGHESLAYGIDWKCGDDVLASCSFYDHLLTLWEPEKKFS